MNFLLISKNILNIETLYQADDFRTLSSQITLPFQPYDTYQHRVCIRCVFNRCSGLHLPKYFECISSFKFKDKFFDFTPKFKLYLYA